VLFAQTFLVEFFFNLFDKSEIQHLLRERTLGHFHRLPNLIFQYIVDSFRRGYAGYAESKGAGGAKL
jgi:hypothetical protein